MFGRRGSTSETAQAAKAAAAIVARATEKAAAPAAEPPVMRRSEEFYTTKSSVFAALIETIDLSIDALLEKIFARELTEAKTILGVLWADRLRKAVTGTA